MNATVVYERVKILNLVPRESDDHTIHWFEVVTMQGSDINTLNCDKLVFSDLVVGEEYSLVLSIQEVVKASGNKAFKTHKFKITDYIPFQSEN